MRTGLLLCFFLVSTPVIAGSGAHGGGDLKSLPDTFAWFSSVTGRSEARFCIYRDASHAPRIPEAELVDLIKEAFGSWTQYIRDNAHKQGVSMKHLRNLSLTFSPVCQNDTEIVFYVGTEDSSVAAAKKAYDNPIAFAHLLNFDLDKGWGRGFIWLHPASQENPYVAVTGMSGIRNLTWDNRLVLRTVLLHEIGHVLGVPHISGTIMTNEIVDVLVSTLNTAERYPDMTPDDVASRILAIEHGNTLIPCANTINGCVRRVVIPKNQRLFSGLDRSKQHFLNLEQYVPLSTTRRLYLRDPNEPRKELLKFSMAGMDIVPPGKPSERSFVVCAAPNHRTECGGIERPSFSAIGVAENGGGGVYLFEFNQNWEVEVSEHRSEDDYGFRLDSVFRSPFAGE